MTNHWADMANATCVVVMGANPSENHPASMGHINKARAKGAKLIVVDPRKTRTAAQADQYIRIRPGTDIAMINGVTRYIINWMESNPTDSKSINFFAYLNQTANGTFFSDGDATLPSASKSVPGASQYSDARLIVKADGTDYDRHTIVATTGVAAVGGEAADTIISNYPKRAAAVTGDPNTVFNRLKAHVAPYTTAVVADVCGCSEAEIAALAMAYVENSRCASVNGGSFGAGTQDPNAAGYKATTMLYAMGLTQHTYGSQNVKSFAVLQTLMGNMGRCGGGINALRGIHNVQGSTDMGLLFGNIPAYSGNPSLQPSTDANAFGKYMDALWGTPLSGTGNKAQMNGSYDDAYTTAAMGLQQRGFYNMTQKFFGTPDTINRANIDKVYSLWPKGNGDDHITMFRKMGTGATKTLVCWGQNPAVTEPNQSAVRTGLENLEMLVCVDMFANETALCDRNALGVTYLLPACSHVEEAGSATNSGRTLQWRYQARKPLGNSKADMELLLRLAYALDQANAFSHIEAVWDNSGTPIVTYTSVFDELYGAPYGWSPAGATAFEDVSGSAEQVGPGNAATTETVTGSEWVAELVYREMAAPTGSGGTIWIYTGAYNAGGTWTTDQKASGQAPWVVQNKAKSRDNTNDSNISAFHGWGYAWLVNRRVFYNNGEIPGDVADFFMGPDSCSRLFVSTSTAVLNYSRWYRTIHRLVDVPKLSNGSTPAIHVLPGRFPAHTEPYESPRDGTNTANGSNLVSVWGQNTAGGTYGNLLPSVGAATAVGTAADFPLVMTSIRCVEHFQGGPITRNNAFNVEAEPEPWVEINSLDARKYGISDGDWVNVITARSNSTTDQTGRTTNYTASGSTTDNFGRGFRARVGVGPLENQRVKVGVVAIPWHWGDAGLSTGSRANDLCIDAADANTKIPEYKACLCKIEKA